MSEFSSIYLSLVSGFSSWPYIMFTIRKKVSPRDGALKNTHANEKVPHKIVTMKVSLGEGFGSTWVGHSEIVQNNDL